MDYTKHNDADLMSLIRSRDVDGFDTLRLRYVSGILRHLQSIVHDADVAEDLLQETLLRVWTRAEQWDGRGTVKGWLYRISTNLALNSLRSTKRRRETPLEIKSDRDDDESVTPGWMIDSATPAPPEALEPTTDAAGQSVPIRHNMRAGLTSKEMSRVSPVVARGLPTSEANGCCL